MNKRKQIIFRLDEETTKKLQHHCIDSNTTVQKLLEEYVKKLVSEKVHDQ
jgi:hypothetical protein